MFLGCGAEKKAKKRRGKARKLVRLRTSGEVSGGGGLNEIRKPTGRWKQLIETRKGAKGSDGRSKENADGFGWLPTQT